MRLRFKDPADYAFFLLFVTLLISMISSMLAWPDGLPFNGQLCAGARCTPGRPFELRSVEKEGKESIPWWLVVVIFWP